MFNLSALLICLLGSCNLLVGVQAFVPSSHPAHPVYPAAAAAATSSVVCLQAGLTLEQIQLRIDCYEVSVPKPLGVIFGENPPPYQGLVVDDISEGMNGGKSGLRQGDQLVAVNGKVIIGFDFDSAMSKMTGDDAGPVLDLALYRGPVRQLYTILGNQLEEGETVASDDDEDDGEDDDDDDSEVVIMDENYESPVQIDMSKYEDKPLTAGDFVKAIGKLGSMLAETAVDATADEPTNEDDSNEKNNKKKKTTGFFGFGGESIQLDGDDAKGYK